MSNIIVNTTNPQYRSVTNNKGTIGIGTPFASTTNSYEIEFTQDNIQSKYEKLVELRETYKNASIADIKTAEFGGFSSVDEFIRTFQRRLRDILYTTNIPTQVLGNNVNTFFPYVQQWNSFRGNTGTNVSNNQNLYSARSFIVDPILKNWIQLFNDILNGKPGLSSVLPTTTTERQTETFGPDEASRTQQIYGQVTINILPYEIPITTAILSASRELVRLKTLQFFDEAREYKTIVNFGNDKQYLVESWRSVASDSSSIQLKLVQPIDSTVQLYQSASIVEEFAKPIIDVIGFELLPEVDTTPFLRPKNTDVGKFKPKAQSIKNVTLQSLQLNTGSVGSISASNVSYEDRVFNRWYTSDFNSSELNINFSDYNNFVFFGSAEARLQAFANKLQQLQQYSTKINTSTSTLGERKNALEIEYIKRNFDPYEQFLYYASQSVAYSASAYYTETGIEYNATGSWPKVNNVPSPYASVTSWFATQSAIAQRFDEFNPNYLVKHLPNHIQEDENSEDFIKFIQMFGHVMDNLKVYVDQFSNIYSTTPAPFDELSMDQVYEVATSFGLQLPNAYSLETLQSFISSVYDGVGARALVAETWKRFIHSSVYLRKLKGTKTGTDALLNTYGINSPLIQTKESTYAVEGNYIKSDESVYGLQFTGSISSSIRLPFVSSSYSASNIQVRFLPELRQKSSLLTTNGTWGIDVVPHPSGSTTIQFSGTSSLGLTSYFTIIPETGEYGRLEIISGSNRTVIASSSYFPLFSDTYTHIMLNSQSQNLTIIQTDGDQLLHQETASFAGTALPSLWNSTFVYIGGTGSLRFNNFDGIIDDVRIWGENTTADNFVKQAYDPGSYYGTTYSSSYNSLYVDLSFSQTYASITQSATNESPFVNVAALSNLPTTGFTTASYTRIVRTIKQFTPIVGASIFSNRKVTIAPPPVFSPFSIDNDGAKILSPNSSIKPAEEKKYTGGQDYVQFAISPTDFINQTIVRSMGDIDTNYLIGSPRKFGNERYTELDDVFEFFLKNYNERIDVNQYTRFFRNATKAPSEYIESVVPARAKLVNGIVIESSMLDRYKTYIQRSIKVDGSNTRTFEKFVAGSGSIDVGAYDFFAYYPRTTEVNTTEFTNPTPLIQKIGVQLVTSSLVNMDTGIGFVDATFDVTSTVGPVSSTETSKLPPFKRYTQQIGTTPEKLSSYATSSFFDNNSSIGFVDAIIDSEPRQYVTQSGYPRNPYLGLRYTSSSQLLRVESEVNTFGPIYEIKPTSDLDDIGATTYFYNTSGLYWLPDVLLDRRRARLNKQFYRTKFNLPIGEIDSVLTRELSSITLLDPQYLTDYPGRFSFVIPSRTYVVGTPYKGVLNIANLISLYRLNGLSGLRVRLYASQQDQDNDLGRSFATLPTPDANVLFDGLLDGIGEVFPYVILDTNDSLLYFTVDNVSSASITSSIEMTYFEYEPANLAPSGYLVRHYRFSRTNNIADRRKSHLGCRAIFCPEGCPPDVTDPNNRTGKVLPRRLQNGTLAMPSLAVESDSPVQVFTSTTNAPIVNNPEGPPDQPPLDFGRRRVPGDDTNRLV